MADFFINDDLKEKFMTISVSGTASGNKMCVRRSDGFTTSAQNGGFSFGLSKGQAVVLTEDGDTTDVALFKFKLGQAVEIVGTPLTGEAIGRSETSLYREQQYLVRGRDSHGDVKDIWYDASQLCASS